MNRSAELTIEESDPFSSIHAHTAGEMGAEAAARYLQSHASFEDEEESLLPEIAGTALAAAFVFGIFLGRHVRQ